MAAASTADPSSAAATAPRPPFHPVDTTFDDPKRSRDDVESPSLSNSNALARFEFEPGRSNKDGTKVLMVEWQEDAASRAVRDADWEISWDDKRAAVLPAKDAQQPQEQQQQQQPQPDIEPVNRMYFLLLPGMPVPTTVRLQKGPTIAWRTNPLPAIFAPELGATAREAGKKGVLHTHWAKKRLQVLQAEISAEAAAGNAEGIGLEIALAEREWIEQNFGVVARPAAGMTINTAAGAAAAALNSPTSPRSPGGGRLMDKLKGLKLGTSASELHNHDGPPAPSHNPLSPEVSDVAVGGADGTFASFLELKGARPTGELGAKPAQPPPQQSATGGAGAGGSVPQRQFEAVLPPQGFGLGLSSVGAEQQQGGMASMDALFTEVPFRNPSSAAGAAPATKDEAEDEDDLFALPMSPRSPEMAKSPFSFAAQDVSRYVKGEKA